MRVLSVGELLWDIMGGKEFLGGAPLNFSVSSRRLGGEVAFVSAVGADRRGELAIQSMRTLGLDSRFVQIVPEHDTGTAIVTTDNYGNASFLIRRPAAFDFIHIDDSILSYLADMHPDWIYFGTLAQTRACRETILDRLIAAAPGARRFYDMNLREGHWNLGLVRRLSGLASIIKVNQSEAETLFRLSCGSESFSLEGFCRHWSRIHEARIICVTLGRRGCAIWFNDTFRIFEGFSVEVADTVGAGDAFSAAFLHGLQLRWPMEQIAAFANALGAIVAGRAGASPPWTIEECLPFVALPAGRDAQTAVD